MAKSKDAVKKAKVKVAKARKPLETGQDVLEALGDGAPVVEKGDPVVDAQDLLNTAKISMGAGGSQVRFVTEGQFNQINSLLSQARGS